MQASCVLTVPCMGSMASHYAYPGSSKTLVDSCGAADGRDPRGDVFLTSRCLCVRVGDVIQCICSCSKPAGLGPDAGDAARRVGAGASPCGVAPPSSPACKTEYLAESLDALPRSGTSCSGGLSHSPVALYADMSSPPSAQRFQNLVYAPGSIGSNKAASSRLASSRVSSSRLATPRPDHLHPPTVQQAHARTVPEPTSMAASLKTPVSSSRLHSRKLSAIRKRDHLKSVAGSKPTSYLRSRDYISSSAKSARCDAVGATVHQTATTKIESPDFLSQSLPGQNSVARVSDVSGLSAPGESAESKTVSTRRSGLRHFKPDLSAPVSGTVEAIVSDIELDGGDDTESVQRSKRMRKKNRFHSESDTDFFGRAYVCRNITIPDPSNQKLCWTKPPLSVLIIRKHFDESVMIPFKQLVTWLVKEKNMVVFVEQSVMEDSILKDQYDFQILRDKLNLFRESDDLTDKVDFIICLGGDGTLLYVSSLFQGSVPPVMAFNMGSLGFLTPFHFSEDFKGEVSRVMEGTASLLLRYRLKCVVVSHDTDHIPHVKNINKEDSWTKTHKLVLNEVVIDRGPSSYLCNLELYIEGKRVTSVQGDGLIISTPTGSTAYAVAAGASMIHPSVPCIMLTPICPHSLSFRPIVVPAGVEIKVMLSPDARGTAMVSFDGRDRREIHVGDSLRITTASYPVPSICATDQIEDWFDGLANCLNWNIRQQQRPLHSVPSATSLDSLECEATNPPQKLANGGSLE